MHGRHKEGVSLLSVGLGHHDHDEYHGDHDDDGYYGDHDRVYICKMCELTKVILLLVCLKIVFISGISMLLQRFQS